MVKVGYLAKGDMHGRGGVCVMKGAYVAKGGMFGKRGICSKGVCV